MTRIFDKQTASMPQYRIVPAGILNEPPIQKSTADLAGLGTSALNAAEHLSEEAIVSITLVNPVIVIRKGREFEVIANLRTYILVTLLPPDTDVGVLEVPESMACLEHLALQVAFLSSATHSLEPSSAALQYVHSWQECPDELGAKISFLLRTRSGLQRLLSIRRQDYLKEPNARKSAFRNLLGLKRGDKK